MANAQNIATRVTSQEKDCSLNAIEAPIKTGTNAAARVCGRAADIQTFMVDVFKPVVVL